jgi:putative restriction endonuclease
VRSPRQWPGATGIEAPLSGRSLHHRLFDRGGVGIDEARRVVVSQLVNGGEQVHHMLLRFHGERLRDPQDAAMRPQERYLEWHRHEVFRAPARTG